MIRLRIDGPGTADFFVAQFSESGAVVRKVYRKLRRHLTVADARDAIINLAIALGQVA
jgi:hypothetical protein